MKITVRNLGIIKNAATIDLKPLTIFIGPNNTGKTWLSYALSGIFGSYGLNRYIQDCAEEQIFNAYEPLDNAVSQVLDKGSATIDLHRFANEYAETYFNDVAKLARVWMSRMLSTQHAHFNDLDISLSLGETKAQLLRQVSNYSRRSNIATGPKGSSLTIRKRRGENKLYIFTATETKEAGESEKTIEEEIPREEIKQLLVTFVARALHRSLYPQTYTFPTDRITLVTSNFFGGSTVPGRQTQVNEKVREALETLFKELEGMKTLAGQGTAIREGMQPVGAFLHMFTRIAAMDAIEKEGREKDAKNNPQVRKYIEIAETLQKEILTGNIEISTPTLEAPRRELFFQSAQGVSLELSVASSMVQQLSPLVLYLRYLAEPGDLLIIDEPEMNLHPQAQAQFIELLAMLVNAGLNVLFTTHSPYITDHLANLITATKSEDKEAIRDEFYLKSTDAFIPQEKVAIYGFSGENVSSILGEDGLIDWDTFGKVSEHIINIYFKL
jgi:predicted ATP-dependent endonuclease of OLD family